MPEALDTSEKAQYHKVTFTFGSPQQVLRFTNWDSELDPAGLSFIPLPSMEFDLAANSGIYQEDNTKMKMTIDDVTEAFLDPLTRGTPFPQVTCLISEVIEPARVGDSGSERIVYRGRVYRTRRNANGKNGLCVLEIRNTKTLLDVALGFQVNAHCVWRLNGVGCTEPSAQSPDGYATEILPIAIDGKNVTVTDTFLDLDLAGSRSWTRGFINRNDTNIGIMFYDKTQDGVVTKEFTMVRQPPVEWEGQLVTFFPGCTKQIDGDGGCRDAWDNEEGFGGAGFAIPAYNPITENPAGI